MIGHNSGRADEPGKSWRRHVWAKARKNLIGTLPVEVVRLRVKRAKELGLPYKTYAGFRASTGHDLIGFLFSNNALLVLREGQGLSEERASKLASLVHTDCTGIAHRPVTPTHLSNLRGLARAFAAPRFSDSWSSMRDQVRAIVTSQGQPADRFVMIGDTAFEREWAEAARMAGYLSASDFFDDAPSRL
ncbi:hypothetical protein SLH49_06925 [Cognatiyoonia sp. IB215446]|uniref:hypothetical protein n=1 Tax=Cognatiyoonia sp. IB215446 TaxID=3097355 RepID=UPI002A0EBBA8|nr:hypothetical protein [Cognatiyoonia sp. IB215446]MDX8347715.1 hypothetical protein [Cognatiyoonia sp. IB215446]